MIIQSILKNRNIHRKSLYINKSNSVIYKKHWFVRQRLFCSAAGASNPAIDDCPITVQINRLSELAKDHPKLVNRVVSHLDEKAKGELNAAIKKEIEFDAGPLEAIHPTQLRRLAIWYGVPMIGFGFCDNAIMILAGDYIDASL
eukprot:UN26284